MRIVNWIQSLLSQGRYTFTKKEAINHFPKKSNKTIEVSLYRLIIAKEIQSPFKEFYVIVPLQYRNLGGLPPLLYISDLMHFLGRDYYISHLSAASLHGAAHQQPQEFFVVHNKQSLRKIKKSILPINFTKREKWNKKVIGNKKTETGYIQISNPLMTAFDLFSDQRKVGGINRVATILDELVSQIIFDQDLINEQEKVVIQRLGYILDFLDHTEQANDIFDSVFKKKKPRNRYPLKPGRAEKGYSSKNRWNIIENIKIEIDQ